MATEYEIVNRKLYVRLAGELDHHLAAKVRSKCEVILKSYPIQDIEFDFTNSAFMDSSGVGMILGRYRQIQPMGGTITLSHINGTIERILKMSGLLSIVKVK